MTGIPLLGQKEENSRSFLLGGSGFRGERRREERVRATHPSDIAPGNAPGALPDRGVSVEGFDTSMRQRPHNPALRLRPAMSPRDDGGGSRPGQTAGGKTEKGRGPFLKLPKSGRVLSRTSAVDGEQKFTISSLASSENSRTQSLVGALAPSPNPPIPQPSPTIPMLSRGRSSSLKGVAEWTCLGPCGQ